jgi:hypothetical protein
MPLYDLSSVESFLVLALHDSLGLINLLMLEIDNSSIAEKDSMYRYGFHVILQIGKLHSLRSNNLVLAFKKLSSTSFPAVLIKLAL